MATYDNELKGVLFKNEDKQTETHPDYKGSATIKGVDYFLDAWINTAETGRKYMSLKLKAKEKQPQASAPAPRQQPQRQQAAPQSRRDDDSDIPFATANPAMDMEPNTARRLRKYHY